MENSYKMGVKNIVLLFATFLLSVLAEDQKDGEILAVTPRDLKLTPFNLSALILVSFFTMLIIFIVGLTIDTDTPTRFEEKMPPIMKEY
ncbi:hypothetical protein CPHLJ_8g4785 [Cryptosporidium parvum]|uniref:Transmembrane protein n=1 Tax=Cryptosporidium hominis TaxID=237895 RepID=A0ABX5BLZ1_CRYHO|nr:hypothetical protein [Cryptosporidium hominis TU502]OLQ16358.1 hypothetical protein ChTU502y2012_377g0005 [Cryptosporidium hominis]PPS98331.1 Uncharacterized protein GY17_00000927 [Cryptosporidium hominis]TRY50067.1 Uncharacterized protein CTYZ_00000518 [Cryptosporidium tyzzeri]|eukprot:PPS98331.1 Uncharacterized protein GY17_00000927 [Cryptosporidium hominis]